MARFGSATPPRATPKEGRKKERELLNYFALLGQICKSSPGIAPSDTFSSIATIPLAPTSSKKPRLNPLRKCPQNHPACLTCHSERSNSSRCALNLSPSLSLSLSTLHHLSLFRIGIGIELSWVVWVVCNFVELESRNMKLNGVSELECVHKLCVKWILDNFFCNLVVSQRIQRWSSCPNVWWLLSKGIVSKRTLMQLRKLYACRCGEVVAEEVFD